MVPETAIMTQQQVLVALEDIYSEAISNLPGNYFEAVNYCRRLNLHKGVCYAAEKLSPGAGTTVFAGIHNKYKALGYICKTVADCRDSIEIKHTLIERLRVIKSLNNA